MTAAKENTCRATFKKTLSIKVLGVGGAGCNAVSHIAAQPLEGLSFAAMNTDAAALEQSSVETKIVLGARCTRGLGAGGDPERGQAAAEEDVEAIRGLCQGADIVFVIAGLGGGTGTGAGPVVARVARETGALVLGMAVLPFECEGARRQRQALLGLQELKGVADGVICLPNQKILKLIDERTSLLQAFQITNDLLAQGVRGLWRLLSRPGLINVDFADLCAVTRDKHGESSLAGAEAQGEHRIREVIEKLLLHPLIEGGQALAEASEVLVCIAGGPELALADVHRIMEQVNRQCEQAHLIMGAAVIEELRERIVVTVIASAHAVRSNMGAPAPVLLPPLERPKADETRSLTREQPIFENPELSGAGSSRPPSRFVPPAPVLSQEQREQLLNQKAAPAGRLRKSSARLRQTQLPLEIISKGRFEKSEPTIYHGQDLDVPTYIRRGVALN